MEKEESPNIVSQEFSLLLNDRAGMRENLLKNDFLKFPFR